MKAKNTIELNIVTNFTKLGFILNWRWQYCLSDFQMIENGKTAIWLFFFLFFCPLATSISGRSTTWWCCLQTGPTWRMPAECKNTRTSSRRRSRSFMTSTPPAQRSVSTPTRKGPEGNLALPLRPFLPHPFSLLLLSVSLPSSPQGGGWHLGPLPPLMSLVRHTTMWSGGDFIQTSSVTNSNSNY